MNLVTKATVFAARAHENMTRKGSGLPYILHPMEAAAIVATMTDSHILIAAALLHDVLEDTPVTYEELFQEFGREIADLVQQESEDKSKSWMERKGLKIKTLPDKPEAVKIVALGDKLSNMRSTWHDYHLLGDRLWERFRVKEKALQGWYYQGLLEGFESLNRFRAYEEYRDLVQEVFGSARP